MIEPCWLRWAKISISGKRKRLKTCLFHRIYPRKGKSLAWEASKLLRPMIEPSWASRSMIFPKRKINEAIIFNFFVFSIFFFTFIINFIKLVMLCVTYKASNFSSFSTFTFASTDPSIHSTFSSILLSSLIYSSSFVLAGLSFVSSTRCIANPTTNWLTSLFTLLPLTPNSNSKIFQATLDISIVVVSYTKPMHPLLDHRIL